jgi:hypothetical protein
MTLLTYAQVRELMAECKSLGMRKGMFHLHGWIKGGYDESHPDIWPPEASLGSVEELKALCAEPDPYLTCLHDNYQDIYSQSPSFPQGICRCRDGALLRGGVWQGGQAYILNSHNSLEYAQRNLPHLCSLGLRAIYVDTVTAEALRESYEVGNTQTRSQDCSRKIQLLRLFLDRGMLLASEYGVDWGSPYIACAPVSHQRVAGESIPLWPLVYHDSVMSFRGTWNAEEAKNPAGFRLRCLENMLWGYQLTFGGFTCETWPLYREAFASTFYVDEFHHRVAMAEMTGHRFLSEDCQVEMTEFANGIAVLVNFADQPRQAEGRTIPAHGYAITDGS